MRGYRGGIIVFTMVALAAGTATMVAAGNVATGDNINVTVTNVVDGDTIDIRYPNGTTDTVRFIGIDTPEIYTETDPAEFEGVPDTPVGHECLSNAADNASAAVKNRLAGENITLQFDNQSDTRGSFGRLLAYVVIDGQNLNYQLVDQGYARVYDSTFEQSSRFYAAESDAQAAERGLWRCRSLEEGAPPTNGSTSGIALSEIHADAAGNDNQNLTGEWITLWNSGNRSLDISGWTVSDAVDQTYTVPNGMSLAPNAEVTLFTGSGTDTSTTLYWGSGRAIWNNGGDTVIVANQSGSVLINFSYTEPNQELATPRPPPTLPGTVTPADDLDGDGHLEDTNGDGVGDVFDVIAYYNHRHSHVVRQNPSQFDFDRDGTPGTIFDALHLYDEIV